MLAEKHWTAATAEAVALAQLAVAQCRAELATADHALEIARLARDGIDEIHPDLVIIADEHVRGCHRARGVASDRLDAALDVLASRQREVTS